MDVPGLCFVVAGQGHRGPYWGVAGADWSGPGTSRVGREDVASVPGLDRQDPWVGGQDLDLVPLDAVQVPYQAFLLPWAF